MKNIELMNVLDGIGLLKDLRGVKLCYAINRNREKIEKELRRIEKFREPGEAYTEYRNQHRELFLKYCIKDKNGAPKTFEENGNQVNRIEPDDLPTFEKEAEELVDKYREAIDEQTEKNKTYQEALLGEVADDFSFYNVKMEFIPDEVTCEQMAVLMHFIDDDEAPAA